MLRWIKSFSAANNEQTLHHILEKAKDHLDVGELAEGENLVRLALAENPNEAEALHLAGFIAMQRGDFEQAQQVISQALEQQGDQALYHFNLGNCLAALGKHQRAAQSFETACQMKPDYSAAWTNLGHVLSEIKRYEEAIPALENAYSLAPTQSNVVALAQALTNAGLQQKQHAHLQRALCLLETYHEIDDPSILLTQARALEGLWRLTEAAAKYDRLISLKPGHPGYHNNLAGCYFKLGRVEEAITHFRRCYELAPEFPDTFSRLLTCLNYLPQQSADSHSELLKEWESNNAAKYYPINPRYDNDRNPDRPLKIGYLSPDLYQHTVGALLLPVLEHHDQSIVDIYCYHTGPKTDSYSKRIAQLAKVWRHVYGTTDEELAQLIRNDGIDILVDLAGHTPYSRPLVFARKPAPIQVSWLGYFNTTGLATMDWFITDQYSYSPEQESRYSEKIYRLPDTRLVYVPYPGMPDVNELPALKNGYITFGCLNNLAKINEEVLSVWKHVLDAVPNSRLLLQNSGFRDPENKERFARQCKMLEIGPERLDLRPFTSIQDFAKTYHEIDIALDPFPFCGGMTSFDALWMGVPVITLAQPQLAGRQTLSMLHNLNLETLISSSIEDYWTIAKNLASDYILLSQVREELRNDFVNSPLYGRYHLARDLEQAYFEIWKIRK